MVKYVTLVKQRLAGFSTWKLEHVPKDSNEKVDALAVVVTSLLIIETIFVPILTAGFLDSHYSGKPGGRNLPFLDEPHSTVHQHGRTPYREGQGSQGPSSIC